MHNAIMPEKSLRSIPIIAFFIALLIKILLIVDLPIVDINKESLLVTELLNFSFYIQWWVNILFGVVIAGLIYYIALIILGKSQALIAASLYLVNPWSSYIEVSGSIYILDLLLFLSLFSGFLIKKNSRLSLGVILVSSLLLMYTSILNWVILPIIIFSLYKSGLIQGKKLKLYLFLLAIFLLPLLFITFENSQGIRNIYSNEITVFSDVGLFNTVNKYRGETKSSNFSTIGKFVENKYTYLTEHLLLSVMRQFTPLTYFTPQFRLLGFSFSPPVFLGFLIPFFWGIVLWLRNFKKSGWLSFAAASLMLPSILTKNSPDLARLILFSPVIFLITSEGIIDVTSDKRKIYRILFFLTIALVILQLFTVLPDIPARELQRYQMVFHQK